MYSEEKDINNRFRVISSIGEEIIGEEYLKNLLANKKHIHAYDGFEPSGRMHLAQGIMRAYNVNKFIDAGIKFKFWVADWFALMNLKLGGDLKKIQKAGKDMIQIWKACGMKTYAIDEEGNPMIEFIWSSEEITKRSEEYWKLVLDIATKFSLNRIKKCTQIMGKKEEKCQKERIDTLKNEFEILKADIKNNVYNTEDIDLKLANFQEKLEELSDVHADELYCSQVFYPVMQCADIFFLGIDICSLGMDQRKVNSLAIEYCDKIKRKNKPVIISHHMVMGLDGSDKMSKSNPDNAIFMDDTPSEVKRKITKAFCEPRNVEKNPLLDWAKHIIFPVAKKIVIPENIKWNEPEIIFDHYDHLEKAFSEDRVKPKALKDGMINHINDLLKPVREKLSNNKDV